MKNFLFPLWVIIDALLFMAVISLWVTAPEFTTLNLSLTIFASILGILLVFIKLQEIKIFTQSHYFKKMAYHLINVLLVLGIVCLINYLGNKNFKEFDLTQEKKNSLTDQTSKVLEMVKSPLKMTVFAKREEWEPMLNLLKLYKAHNKFIEIAAIDTDLRPDLVKTKNITQNGTVIITYDKKESAFPIIDELSVTNALLKALRDDQIIIYQVTGHQELDCSNKTPEGASFLCEKLGSQNYIVKSLDLTKTTEVPKDASSLMIMGPISSFLPDEALQVEAYLKRGGSLFLALAPAFKAELYDNLTRLTKPFGLELGKDVVIDRLSTVQGAEATIPIITKYESDHPITSGLNLRTVFPLSSSVRRVEGNDTAQLLALTSSFPGSWAESDLKGITKGRAEYKEGEDLKGPIGLMGAGERLEEGQSRVSRVVLLGSSSFLVNAYQGQSGNTTLFLNAMSWVVNDEGIISLNRPGTEEEAVVLSTQHIQMIFVISILLVPIIFFGTAIFVYRRRRLL